MYEKMMGLWQDVQNFFDVSGDMWMALMTGAIVFRFIYTALGHAPLSTAEAAAYASAVATFGYSNKK